MNAVDPGTTNRHSKRRDPAYRDEDRAIRNGDDKQKSKIAQGQERYALARRLDNAEELTEVSESTHTYRGR
jgi:hypothetical protein